MGGYREEQKPQSIAGSVHRAIKRPVGLGQWGSGWEILSFIGQMLRVGPGLDAGSTEMKKKCSLLSEAWSQEGREM